MKNFSIKDELIDELEELEDEFDGLRSEDHGVYYEHDGPYESVWSQWSKDLVAINRQIDISDRVAQAMHVLEKRDWFLDAPKTIKAALDAEIKELVKETNMLRTRREDYIAQLGYVKTTDNEAYVLI